TSAFFLLTKSIRRRAPAESWLMSSSLTPMKFSRAIPYTSHALSFTSTTVAWAASKMRIGSLANRKRLRYSWWRFVSALSSLHLLQEKIAKAKAKKTRTAVPSFTCQELYRADHAANFSKESKRI